MIPVIGLFNYGSGTIKEELKLGKIQLKCFLEDLKKRIIRLSPTDSKFQINFEIEVSNKELT